MFYVSLVIVICKADIYFMYTNLKLSNYKNITKINKNNIIVVSDR